MWCLALVATYTSGQWTHLGLELDEEMHPGKTRNREPLRERLREWRIQLELEWGGLGDDVAFVPEALGRGDDGRLGDLLGRVQRPGPGKERKVFFERQMDGPGEGLRAKCRGRGLAGVFFLPCFQQMV